MGKLHFGAPLLGALFITGLGLAACSSDPVVVSPPGSGGAGSGGAGGEAPSCVDGETLCGDACAATDSDVAHCGACGNACAPGEVCSEGSCAIACPAGQTVCGDACVDLDADRAHCGACDSACDEGLVCDGAGSCALTCQDGLVDCGGTCVDPLTDRTYCGAGADCSTDPGLTCIEGEICDGNGTCALTCQDGLVDCGGTCIDPLTDRAYCGAGADCTTDPGSACADGEICDGTGACQLSCQDGLVDCGGTCIDPLTDRDHCGAETDCASEPGAVCGSGELCNAGQCELSCADGWVDCNGVCINPDTNILHCGATGSCLEGEAGEFCDVGEACSGGTCTNDKLVFISSVTRSSFFGGIPGADEFCQQLADAAGLPGTYWAWLSDDNISPANRFVQSTAPYRLVDGTKIADDWTDLTDGTLDHPINLTEYGRTPPDSSIGTCQSRHTFWTNTTRSGNTFSGMSDCTDWTGVSENGSAWGRWDDASFLWTEYCGGGSCNYVATVACFQQ